MATPNRWPVYFADWIGGKERNDYSQFGEDGLIESIFERIGTTSKLCFEIGAADGLWFSNTATLIAKGWRGILIEGDPGKWEKLGRYASERRCVAICTTCKPDGLDVLLGAFDGQEIDLGIIDVDGPDYWMWHHLKRTPRAMCVEYACSQIDLDRIPPKGEGNVKNQAGGAAIRTLGEAKGYRLVAATQCNMLFIREDCYV